MQCGLLVHLTAAAVGVAALLPASAAAFPALELAGAAYLVVLAALPQLASPGGSSAGRASHTRGHKSRSVSG